MLAAGGGSARRPAYRGQVLFLGMARDCRQNETEGQRKISLRETGVPHKHETILCQITGWEEMEQ